MLTRLFIRLALIGCAFYAFQSDAIQDRIAHAKQELYSAQVAFERLQTGDFTFGGNR